MIDNETFALEFTKWLLNGRTVTRHISMTESETYVPKEYKLLLGEIIANGDKLIDEFCLYKYEEAKNSISTKKEKFNNLLMKTLMEEQGLHINNPFQE